MARHTLPRGQFSPQQKSARVSVDWQDFDSFLENMNDALAGIKGVGTVLETVNPSRLHSDSKQMVNDGQLLEGLASVLAACINEMQHEISRIRRGQ